MCHPERCRGHLPAREPRRRRCLRIVGASLPILVAWALVTATAIAQHVEPRAPGQRAAYVIGYLLGRNVKPLVDGHLDRAALIRGFEDAANGRAFAGGADDRQAASYVTGFDLARMTLGRVELDVDVTFLSEGCRDALGDLDSRVTQKEFEAAVTALGPHRVQKVQVVTNSMGMQLVRIPAGEFSMGSTDNTDSQPVHRVRITRPFLMGQTEVTQGQFAKVMGTTPWRGRQHVKEGPDVAVSYVTWNDAVEFCRRLTESERKTGRLAAGRSYRLPTEAEWEYACRAGTTTRFSFGDDKRLLGDHAWWGGLDDAQGNATTEQYAHAVGLKRPNPWSLFDVHGNVYEWCVDTYDENYYAASPPADPRNTSGDPQLRVVRGGGWVVVGSGCSSALRNRVLPTVRNHFIGFRVVCECE